MLNTFIYTTQATKNPELFEAITKGYFICYPTKLEDLLKSANSNTLNIQTNLLESTNDNSDIIQRIKNKEFDTNGNLSHDYPIFMESFNKSRHPEALSIYTEDEYSKKQTKLYKIRGYDAGFGITGDGDIISVHNNTAYKNVAPELLEIAKDLGGRKLDHFNIEHLNTLYKNAGFNEYSKYDWNDEYAPPNWNYEKHGRPNVIMRKL